MGKLGHLGIALLPIFNIGLNGESWSTWYGTAPCLTFASMGNLGQLSKALLPI